MKKEGGSIRRKASLLAAAAVTAAAGIGLLAAQPAAATGNTDLSLVERIATRFNLSKDDVQSVFDDERESREAQMETHVSERLQAKVEAGEITADQKTLIEQKLAEMRTEIESEREDESELTHDERHAKMEEKRSELEAWAKEHNIPLKLLHPEHRGRGMHHHPPM